ncbi:hypothetical protein T492DRAFT_887482 [Pavlovales sp. CCMP2436]|nr:hypothetical protein T492DRAFT_887482 [Pavlovales sp. CCMP2436]
MPSSIHAILKLRSSTRVPLLPKTLLVAFFESGVRPVFRGIRSIIASLTQLPLRFDDELVAFVQTTLAALVLMARAVAHAPVRLLSSGADGLASLLVHARSFPRRAADTAICLLSLARDAAFARMPMGRRLSLEQLEHQAAGLSLKVRRIPAAAWAKLSETASVAMGSAGPTVVMLLALSFYMLEALALGCGVLVAMASVAAGSAGSAGSTAALLVALPFNLLTTLTTGCGLLAGLLTVCLTGAVVPVGAQVSGHSID